MFRVKILKVWQKAVEPIPASSLRRLRFSEPRALAQAQIAKIQNFIQDGNFDELYHRADQLARMLSGLRSTLLKDSSS